MKNAIDTNLTSEQIEILNDWLAEQGYATVEDWARDSDYLETDEGWFSPAIAPDQLDMLVDIAQQAWWAMEEAEADPGDRCPACGSVIDYCQGHGEIGDPEGHRILVQHDNDDHTDCDEDVCERRVTLRWALSLTGSSKEAIFEEVRAILDFAGQQSEITSSITAAPSPDIDTDRVSIAMTQAGIDPKLAGKVLDILEA